jgi:hypothetical protein
VYGIGGIMDCHCKNKMIETPEGFFCPFCYAYIQKDEHLSEGRLKQLYFNTGHQAFNMKEVTTIIKVFKDRGFKVDAVDAYLAWVFYSESLGKRWAQLLKKEEEVFNSLFSFFTLVKHKVTNANTNNKNK